MLIQDQFGIIQNLQTFPIPQTSFLVGTFFAASYSKTALGPTSLFNYLIFRDKVVLYVNCQPIGEKPMEIVDSRIDLNGEIVVSKEVESRRTHPIDLQWMVMTCDPQSAERETCDELPVFKLKLLN